MFKIRESNRAATADINIAKVQVNQAENDIALKVRQLYYSILIAQLKQQAAAEEVTASSGQTPGKYQKTFKRGMPWT